ncbi:MAG: FtsK/SpoIIIE domain-containing protein, partial [Planctomycetota bacterium]
MDLLENYLRRVPVKPDYDYPALEETALNDVIKLSPQCIEPIVNTIESSYNTTKEKIETSYQKAIEERNNNYNSQTNRLGQNYQKQLEKIQKEYDAKKHILNTRAKNRKKESADNTEVELAHFKENYDYEIMTVDVLEWGKLKKYQKNMAEIKKSVSLARLQLDELYKNAEQVLSNYKISIKDKPDSPAETDVDTKQNAIEFFRKQKEIAELHLRILPKLFLPKIFLSTSRYIIAVSICIVFVCSLWLINRSVSWKTSDFTLILSGGLFLLIILLIFSGRFLRKKALSRIMYNFRIINQAIEKAKTVMDRYLQSSSEQIEHKILQAKENLHKEKQANKEKYKKSKTTLEKKNILSIKNTNEQYNRIYSRLEDRFNKQLAQIEQQKNEKQKEYKVKYNEKLTEVKKNFTQGIEKIENEHNSMQNRLKKCWLDRLNTIKKLLAETEELDRSLFYNWQNPAWSQWTPTITHERLIRLGEFEVGFNQIAEPVKELMDTSLKGLETVTLPAMLAFPGRCSLFIQTPHRAKDSAINLVKAVMARLFTSVPSGQVHFNIFDPIGLGKNFVAFMHATDYEKTLVGGRIWTESEHIQRCLTELTAHMENVIQKYLRNEYKTIEAYNQQAGEFAEPYRFLVIADFPTNFNDESIRRLRSIINSGPRCGVYTLIVCDESQKLPEGISTKDLALNGVHLVYQKDRFVWQNEILKKFPLQLDSSPPEELLTSLIRKVGIASIDSAKVELPFDTIAPSQTEQWAQDSTFDIKIPIGRSGAKRLQYLQLGKGVNQHMLIAGKTGSGKSTLFHVIISNLALWYSPDEIELYLIDFKQGVEFKTYAAHKLPHARAVAIESDREFGLSILHRLDTEMTIRGEKFRHARVQDISSYRKTTGKKMPRTILIIDEFHILFTDDDKIAHEASILLEKLVRQGRAFGIHIILGSQSLAGTSGISRSIMGQMAVRIALQCSEMDAQIILNEDNVVARLLSRPGEAIYNDAGGMIVGNNPFQVAWLAKITQDDYLSKIPEFPRQLVLSH